MSRIRLLAAAALGALLGTLAACDHTPTAPDAPRAPSSPPALRAGAPTAAFNPQPDPPRTRG